MALNSSDASDGFYEGMNDASGQQDNARTRIDFTRSDFPKPWLPQTGNLLSALRTKHETEVSVLEKLAGRRLDQTEYEAIAYWSCKEAQIRSRGIPMGIALGAYRAYATREQNRFPLWKPKEGFDFNSIKIGSRKIIEGQLARMIWNTARYTAYGLVAGPIVAIIFTGSWGISAANLGRLQDPRTKPLMQEIIRKAQETRAQNTASNTLRNTNRDMSQRTQSSIPTSNDTDSPVNTMFNDPTPQDDPYSPQSSQAASDLANYGTSNLNSNSAPFSPIPRNEQPYTPAYTSTNSADRQSKEPSQFFDDSYDDASPTASYRSTSTSSSSSGGSAWDRIRSGSSTSSSMSSKRQRTSNTNPNGYESPADTDTRSQAQKDFDDRIERERQGRNFD